MPGKQICRHPRRTSDYSLPSSARALLGGPGFIPHAMASPLTKTVQALLGRYQFLQRMQPKLGCAALQRRGSNDEAEDTSDEEDDVDAAADDEQEAEYEEFSDEDEELVADQEDLAYDEPETEDEDEDFSEEDSYDDDEYDSEEEEDAEEAVFSDDDFDGIEGLPKLKGGLDLDEPSEDDLRELEEEMGDDDLGFGDLGFEDAVQELLADEARQPIGVYISPPPPVPRALNTHMPAHTRAVNFMLLCGGAGVKAWANH